MKIRIIQTSGLFKNCVAIFDVTVQVEGVGPFTFLGCRLLKSEKRGGFLYAAPNCAVWTGKDGKKHYDKIGTFSGSADADKRFWLVVAKQAEKKLSGEEVQEPDPEPEPEIIDDPSKDKNGLPF